MAESNEKSFFSTLLQRLFDGDYTSRSIRRHGTIREQIQVLLKSEKVSELSAALHSELNIAYWTTYLPKEVDNNRLRPLYGL